MVVDPFFYFNCYIFVNETKDLLEGLERSGEKEGNRKIC